MRFCDTHSPEASEVRFCDTRSPLASEVRFCDTRSPLASEVSSKPPACLCSNLLFLYLPILNLIHMSELRKANFDAVFFVTLTVVDWIDVFSRQEYTGLLIKNLQFCQQNKGLEIYSYVVMTNHLHLVAGQQEGRLNDVLAHFKSYTAKVILDAIETNPKESRKDWLLHLFRFNAKLKQQYQQYHFWQSTNHPIALTSPAMLMQKINYTHQNPVRAGYVLEPEYWQYSSASAFSPIKVMEI